MKAVRQARLELSGGSTPDQLKPRPLYVALFSCFPRDCSALRLVGWCAQQWCLASRRSLNRTLRSESAHAPFYGLNVSCPAGAQAIADMKDSPSLTTMTLDLSANKTRNGGAQALVELKAAPALVTLTLDLTSTGVGNRGARALAALNEAPALTCLTLRLAGNDLGTSRMPSYITHPSQRHHPFPATSPNPVLHHPFPRMPLLCSHITRPVPQVPAA